MRHSTWYWRLWWWIAYKGPYRINWWWNDLARVIQEVPCLGCLDARIDCSCVRWEIIACDSCDLLMVWCDGCFLGSRS